MRADPLVGTEFAGHRVVGVIGRGGMAVVYLAEHLRLGRKVALKVLDLETAEDEAFPSPAEIRDSLMNRSPIIPTSSRSTTRGKRAASSTSRCAVPSCSDTPGACGKPRGRAAGFSGANEKRERPTC